MKKIIPFLILLLTYSCVREYLCDCKRVKGCKIIKLIKTSDSSLLEKSKYCPLGFYNVTDTNYNTILASMKIKYDTVDSSHRISYKVLLIDSIYKRDSQQNIKSNDTKRFYDSAYICKCNG